MQCSPKTRPSHFALVIVSCDVWHHSLHSSPVCSLAWSCVHARRQLSRAEPPYLILIQRPSRMGYFKAEDVVHAMLQKMEGSTMSATKRSKLPSVAVKIHGREFTAGQNSRPCSVLGRFVRCPIKIHKSLFCISTEISLNIFWNITNELFFLRQRR